MRSTACPAGIKGNKDAVAETIANNVRSKIIKEHLNDPAYYDRMSTLLRRDPRRPEGQAHRLRGVPASASPTWRSRSRAGRPTIRRTCSRPALRDARALQQPAEQGIAAGDHVAEARAVLPSRRSADPSSRWPWPSTRPSSGCAPTTGAGIRRARTRSSAPCLPLLNDDAEEVERIFLIIKAQREY